jgi:signal recognition particle receptor subunit beta
MPHINYESKEIVFKLVYYGPGMSGKTTNLVRIHQSLAENLRGEMVTLDTAEERTLFFDFFPIELGRIEGYSLQFNMYTVPGQSYYEASRRLILDGADGVVFVADSRPLRLEENLASYRAMVDNLLSYELDPRTFPTVLQYNKRDCERPLPVGTLERELGLNGVEVIEAVATRGDGVMETIRAISRQVIQQFWL